MTLKTSLAVATLIAGCLAAPTRSSSFSIATSSATPSQNPDVVEGLLRDKRQDEPATTTLVTSTDAAGSTTTSFEIMTAAAVNERRDAEYEAIDEGLLQTLAGLHQMKRRDEIPALPSIPDTVPQVEDTVKSVVDAVTNAVNDVLEGRDIPIDPDAGVPLNADGQNITQMVATKVGEAVEKLSVRALTGILGGGDKSKRQNNDVTLTDALNHSPVNNVTQMIAGAVAGAVNGLEKGVGNLVAALPLGEPGTKRALPSDDTFEGFAETLNQTAEGLRSLGRNLLNAA